MGAVSKSDMLHRTANLLKDIADALDRGVLIEEVELAIVALERTKANAPRRQPRPV